ncbi:hypothetical protein IIA79_03020 [bacterium]|nr:hypothetical protein [bacterium]
MAGTDARPSSKPPAARNATGKAKASGKAVGIGITVDEARRLEGKSYEDWFRMRHDILAREKMADYGVHQDSYSKLVPKPLGWTLGFGIPGLMLVIGQMWLPEINHALGDPLGGHTGWTRLGAMFLGAYFIFFAWPHFRHEDIR